MKQLVFVIGLIFLLAQPAVFSQTTWKSPGYKPGTMRKVMVLAKIKNEAARQQLEDYTVKFLADKGIDAVPAYRNLTRTKFESREAFMAYMDSIDVDGLLVYNVEEAQKVMEQKPTVSIGVGVGGMYGGYMGASVPVSGGANMVVILSMSGKFYTRWTTGAQWIISLSGKYDGQTDKISYSFAKTTAKAMLKEGLFLPAK